MSYEIKVFNIYLIISAPHPFLQLDSGKNQVMCTVKFPLAEYLVPQCTVVFKELGVLPSLHRTKIPSPVEWLLASSSAQILPLTEPIQKHLESPHSFFKKRIISNVCKSIIKIYGIISSVWQNQSPFPSAYPYTSNKWLYNWRKGNYYLSLLLHLIEEAII